jgi:hypothetical protein
MSRSQTLVAAVLSCAVGGCSPSTNVGGTVVYPSGAPASGNTVVIIDGSNSRTSLTTDANGAFSLNGVTTPYSAIVVESDPRLPMQLRTTTAYLGLTRADPSLVADGPAGAFSENDGTLNVTLSGGTYPQPRTNYKTNLDFASPEVQQASVSLGGTRGATNSLDVTWSDPSSGPTSGTLYALQVHSDESGLPTDYPGYGMTSTSVAAGMATSASLALQPVATAMLSGVLVLPAGYSLIYTTGYLNSGQALLPLFADSTQPRAFAYTTPAIAGTTLLLEALALNATNDLWVTSAVGLAADATGVSLACPVAPALVSPADGQTSVTASTDFSWLGQDNGIYEVDFGGNLVVWTGSTTATLADLLSPDGSPIAGSTEFSWHVTRVSPYASMDALVAPQSVATLPPTLFCQFPSRRQTFTTSANP